MKRYYYFLSLLFGLTFTLSATELQKTTIMDWDKHELYSMNLKNGRYSDESGIYLRSQSKVYFIGGHSATGKIIRLQEDGREKNILIIRLDSGVHSHSLHFFYLDTFVNMYIPIEDAIVKSDIGMPSIFVDPYGYNLEYGYISAWGRYYDDTHDDSETCRKLMESWHRYDIKNNIFSVIEESHEISKTCYDNSSI